MEAVLTGANVCPVVDQVEYHPGLMQEETVALCRKHNILVEAWSPLGRGQLLDREVLIDVAARHGRTVPQVILRWCVQNGVLPLVKSVHADRIRDNFNIDGFELTPSEMADIATIPYFRYGSHPDTAAF